jgi:hypothetical protein
VAVVILIVCIYLASGSGSLRSQEYKIDTNNQLTMTQSSNYQESITMIN